MIIAAIDIGSHATKLKIVDYKKGKFKVVEEVFHQISMGESVLKNGKIDNEKRDELIDCLKYYKKLMSEYGVEKYRALATGVFRNAKNGAFVLELINKRIKLKVEMVEDSIERFLTYLSLKDHLPNYKKMRQEGMLLVEVGSSSSEVIVYKNNKMVRNNEIHMGTLSLKELIQTIKRESLHVPQILEDYIYAATENLQNYLVRKKINHFVILGTEIKRITELFGDHSDGFSRQSFEAMIDMINKQDRVFRQTIEREMLDYYEVLSAISIFEQFFKHTECDIVYVPNVNLRDGILLSIVEDIHKYQPSMLSTQDILTAAKQIAKRHHSTTTHINQIDRHVVKIFEAYRQDEGFSDIDLLMLRLAAILHETGKFSRQVNYHDATYHAIVNASLLGVTQAMLHEIAQITSYFFFFTQGSAVGRQSHSENATKHIKLGLLLALADALDKSKKSHITIKKVKLDDDKLRIKISSSENYFFEKLTVRALNDDFCEINAHKIVLEEN